MIRERIPDIPKSRSLIAAAERQIKFIPTLPVTEQSASIIIKESYDSFRMLGEALMLLRGKQAVRQGHHRTIINELITIPARTERPLGALLNLQELRRKIEYEGYQSTMPEVEDALSLTNACFPPLLEAVKKELKKRMNDDH